MPTASSRPSTARWRTEARGADRDAIRVPAARRGRGPDRGRDRRLEGQAGRHGDGEPGAGRDRDRQVARRAAVALRGNRRPSCWRPRATRSRSARRSSASTRRAGPIELQAPAAGDTVGRGGRHGRLDRARPRGRPSRGRRAGRLRSKGGHATTRRRRPGAVPTAEAAMDAAGAAAGPAAPARRPGSAPAASAGPVIAKPPIRKLAKDLDVDLAAVTATGPIGDITRDDVIRQAQQASVFRNIQTPEWPEDREERIPVKGVRKAIASAMVQSAFTAPARERVQSTSTPRARWSSSSASRPRPTSRACGIAAADHGEGGHLGGAPQPHRELDAGRTRRSSSTTT